MTEQEAAVARYIVNNFVSKEIAEKLHISKKTVDYHRTNIRKKLGLGADENLKQCLIKRMRQN